MGRQSKLKQLISNQWFLILASCLLWLKTYVVERFWFTLPVEGIFQEFILLLTPISSVIFILWLGMLFFRKRRNLMILMMSLSTSGLLFANVVYYRFFNDFITLPVLFQTSNMGDLGSSAFELIKVLDILIFADFFVLAFILWRKKVPQVSISGRNMKLLFAGSIVVFLINLGLAEIVRPELLTRTFDRTILVKSIGAYNYQVYDIFLNSKTKAQKAFASSSGYKDVEKYVKTEKPVTTLNKKSNMFGIAKGKNVILVSLESTQSFVINNTLYGKEITPFLNDFVQESFYFDNFYHQTGQGKTSDAEFMVDNSLYPLPSGSVYFTHSQNVYNSTPKILKSYGYYSAVLHANDKTFWNRDIMYKTLGYDRFFNKADYNVTDENSVGWGLKDIDFFEQSIPMLKQLKQPFYTRFLTLTNHYPFKLDEEDKMIPEYTSHDGTVNRYFTTVRYEDEAIKQFINGLKEAGLYENSIILMYGDHYGISANHDKAMGQYLGKEITPYEHIQLQRVPFIVHIPGVKGKRMSQIGGEIDIRPTLLHLLGIEGKNDMDFGRDLFEDNKDRFVALRDGSFITDNYIYTNDVCYSKYDGVEVDGSLCQPYKKKVDDDLDYSDKIIYGDLMRFSKEIAKKKSDSVNTQKENPLQTEDLPESVQENLQRKSSESKNKP